MSKGKKRSGARPGRPQPLRGTKGKRKGARLWYVGGQVNRAKKSGMVNITSSVNSRERSGINTILHELNPLFTINVTMRDIKSKNVYSRVNSKATTQWRKTESANGVHLEGVASDNRSS